MLSHRGTSANQLELSSGARSAGAVMAWHHADDELDQFTLAEAEEGTTSSGGIGTRWGGGSRAACCRCQTQGGVNPVANCSQHGIKAR
jgi:hypothetical protein